MHNGELQKSYALVRTLWNNMEALCVATGRNGTLQSIAGRYTTLWERCRSITQFLRNVTEPLWKISILPMTNWIVHFAHHWNVSMRALRDNVQSNSPPKTAEICPFPYWIY